MDYAKFKKYFRIKENLMLILIGIMVEYSSMAFLLYTGIDFKISLVITGSATILVASTILITIFVKSKENDNN